MISVFARRATLIASFAAMQSTLRFSLVAGLLFTIFPSGVGAEQVNNWTEASNYPAKITAIPVGGNKLTPKNSVRIGAWTVSFTGQPVIAQHSVQNGCAAISTYNGQADMGLVCSNAVVGSVRCAFVAWLNACGGDGPKCFFFPYADSAPKLNFACPSGLSLN
jgi:hypothetical protein